jgi:hypothetical protein
MSPQSWPVLVLDDCEDRISWFRLRLRNAQFATSLAYDNHILRLDEGNHRSGPYASLAEAAQHLGSHWDHKHAGEDGKFRPLTPAEKEALGKIRSVSADAQQEELPMSTECRHVASDKENPRHRRPPT